MWAVCKGTDLPGGCGKLAGWVPSCCGSGLPWLLCSLLLWIGGGLGAVLSFYPAWLSQKGLSAWWVLLPEAWGSPGQGRDGHWRRPHLCLVIRSQCVTLSVGHPGIGACSTIFHGSGLTLELSRGLYYPPPSSVTSVNGFLITHVNQHDWKFLKFYWEGNL